MSPGTKTRVAQLLGAAFILGWAGSWSPRPVLIKVGLSKVKMPRVKMRAFP